MLRPVLLAVLSGVAVTGCGVTYLDSYLCANPDVAHLDANGNPALLWIGAEADAPACPAEAPIRSDQFHCGIDTTCAPVPPAGAGFRQCISQKGEPKVLACPTTYPDRHVVHDGVDDTRACSPCACGAPIGAKCSEPISFFTDSACGTSSILKLTATSDASICGGVPMGSALGSKSAGPVTFTPSTCEASGGETAEVAKLVGPSIFCCLP